MKRSHDDNEDCHTKGELVINLIFTDYNLCKVFFSSLHEPSSPKCLFKRKYRFHLILLYKNYEMIVLAH